MLQNLSTLVISSGDLLHCRPSQKLQSEIPSSITTLRNLETLSLNIAGLFGSIPNDIGNLASLINLRISSPNPTTRIDVLGSIPASIRSCTHLETLYLTGTLLTNFGLSPSAPSFPQLRELAFTNSTALQITQLFLQPILTSAKSLQLIDFSNTRISFDLGSLRHTPLLQHLDLSGSFVHYALTSSFWEWLPQLRYVAIANCPNLLGSIHPSIGRCQYLYHLDLSETAVSRLIPDEIGLLPLRNLLLRETFIMKPYPESIRLLNNTLQRLVITEAPIGSGTIYDSWGALSNLIELDLSGNGLEGTIPPSLAEISSLTIVRLDNNHLEGTIPPFKRSVTFLDLHNNRLIGSIPPSILSSPVELILSYNELGPSLPDSFLLGAVSNPKLIDLSHNRFTSNLPPIPSTIRIETLILSFNLLKGSIPASYCFVDHLKINNNNLTGTPDSIFNASCNLFQTLHINHNSLTGTIPDLSYATQLLDFVVSDNRFTGPFPQLPRHLLHFEASNNRFSTADWRNWCLSVSTSALEHLDISGNDLLVADLSFTALIGPNLTYLSIARNSMSYIPEEDSQAPFGLTGLDASSNYIIGRFRTEWFPKLANLKLSNNLFFGNLELEHIPFITTLDISGNMFRFDVSLIPSLSLLTTFYARSNLLYGSLVLSGMPSLQAADFGNNELNYAPDLISIGELFSKYALTVLDISENVGLPIITSFDTEKTGLKRSPYSSNSTVYPDTITCYSLAFYNAFDRVFIFDEHLFNYRQCDCNNKNFGFPPLNCHHCPSSGTDSCGATMLSVSANHYAFIRPIKTINAVSNFNNTSSSHAEMSPSSDVDHYQLETETCLQTVLQSLAGKSNCIGVKVTSQDLQNSSTSLPNALDPQCLPGSTGRLCSNCICNATGGSQCYFLKGLAVRFPFLLTFIASFYSFRKS